MLTVCCVCGECIAAALPLMPPSMYHVTLPKMNRCLLKSNIDFTVPSHHGPLSRLETAQAGVRLAVLQLTAKYY